MKKLSILFWVLLSAPLVWAQQDFRKEGHRGCRGLMPENTIAAMKKAIDLGVQVLELDVVISKDKKVIVSHDPYFSAAITTKPSGEAVTVAEQKSLVLYSMPYAQIKKFDVGLKHNAAFPEQQNMPAQIPLLSDLIDSADAYAKRMQQPLPQYNIEIKSNKEGDGVTHPQPDEFVDLVLAVFTNRNLLSRANIQSFDVRQLQIIHAKHPTITLAYLTANKKSVAENFADLGFTPSLYSPYYKSVTKETVDECHAQKVKIIPWTVNTKAEITALQTLSVDGIITDYPNLF